MKVKFESRSAVSSNEVKAMSTEQLRKNFLIEGIFQKDTAHPVQAFTTGLLLAG